MDKGKKRILLAALAAGFFDDSSSEDEDSFTPYQEIQGLVLQKKTQRILHEMMLEALQPVLHPGRGNAVCGIRYRREARIAVTSQYTADRTDPDSFRSNTGHFPGEFDVLLTEMLAMPPGFNFRGPRNLYCGGDPGSELNIQINAAKKHRADLRKLSPGEELYHALKYLRTTSSAGSRRDAADAGVAKAALDDSMIWIFTLMNHPTHGPPSLRNAISWPTRQERDVMRDSLRLVYPGMSQFVIIVDGTKIPHQKNMKSPGHQLHYNQKGYGMTAQVFVDLIGRIRKITYHKGHNNDRGDYINSVVFQQHDQFLDRDEGLMGDGAYRGEKCPGGANDIVASVLVPWQNDEIAKAPNVEVPGMEEFNRLQRRVRLVVENSIGAVKRWDIVRTPSRGDIGKQPHFFELCAKLTTRLQILRNAFPRSIANLQAKQLEAWETLLGDQMEIEDAVLDDFFAGGQQCNFG